MRKMPLSNLRQIKTMKQSNQHQKCAITTLPCTPLNVIESLQEKSIRAAPLRIDTVSMMLTHCNVSPTSRVLIIESGTSGVLLACTAYRKQGHGIIVNLQDKASPVDGQSLNHHQQPDALQKIDLDEQKHQNILHAPFSIVNQAQQNELTDEQVSNHPFGDVLTVLRDGVDCVLIASKYDALDVLQQCMPIMRPCASFAIYNGSCEPLMPVHTALRQSGRFVQVSLAESFMREWQVLPNRTHPHVNMSSNSGYILSGFLTEAYATQSITQRADNSKINATQPAATASVSSNSQPSASASIATADAIAVPIT
jgi:tRNA A58 N-methylase Trm61